jgi:hypothetical protein
MNLVMMLVACWVPLHGSLHKLWEFQNIIDARACTEMTLLGGAGKKAVIVVTCSPLSSEASGP